MVIKEKRKNVWRRNKNQGRFIYLFFCKVWKDLSGDRRSRITEDNCKYIRQKEVIELLSPNRWREKDPGIQGYCKQERMRK